MDYELAYLRILNALSKFRFVASTDLHIITREILKALEIKKEVE